MSEALAVLVYALAVWRVSYMLHRERGPANWFAKLRIGVAMRWPREEDPDAIMFLMPSEMTPAGHFKSWQVALFDCIGCVSVWVALPAAAAFGLRGVPVLGAAFDGIALWQALSALSIAFEIARNRAVGS